MHSEGHVGKEMGLFLSLLYLPPLLPLSLPYSTEKSFRSLLPEERMMNCSLVMLSPSFNPSPSLAHPSLPVQNKHNTVGKLQPRLE